MMTTRSCAASLACCRWRAPLARAASCLGERPTRPNSGHLCRPPPRCRWLLAAASVVAPPSSLRPGATRHVCNARRKKHDSQKWAPVREGENASRSARDADAPHVQWHHNARCVCPCSRRSSATVRPGSARPQNVSPRPHLPASSIATCAGVRPAARASALILSRWSSLSSSA